MKTLSEIKADLIDLAHNTNCDTTIIKDSYVDSGITYSIMYKRSLNKTYKVAPDSTEEEIVIS